MYSTIDGAKQRANSLDRIMKTSGFAYPLRKSQHAVARGGGFRDWHDMTSALKKQERHCDPETFRRRLLEALPAPCEAPVRAWLNREPREEAPAGDVPAGWYRYVFPYQFTAAAMLRHDPAIRRGSGPGQRLREKLVPGVLLNINGGERPYARLEPDTLAMVFEGTPEEVFGKDALHPRFAVELKTLQDAGIIDVRDDHVAIVPPDRDEILDRVLRDKIDKVTYWLSEPGYAGDASNALRDALAAIGIDDALRLAETLLQYGGEAYILPSGPIKETLRDLAAVGRIQAFARFFDLSATIWPKDKELIRGMIPAIILNAYFAEHLGYVGSSRLMAWTANTPEWAHDVDAALSTPVVFERVVLGMAEAIRSVP